MTAVQLTPEEYFFRYAYPCTYTKLRLNKIDKQTYSALHRLAEERKAPDRATLEKVYTGVIRRMRERMHLEGDAIWDINALREYFLVVHNQAIDEGDVDEMIKEAAKKNPKILEEHCDLCKVHRAVVEDTIEMPGIPHLLLKVKYDNVTRNVVNIYDLDVRWGDTVSIHYLMAIEKL